MAFRSSSRSNKDESRAADEVSVTDAAPGPDAAPIPDASPVPDASQWQEVVDGTHADPHRFLGVHDSLIRAFRPDATSVDVVLGGTTRLPMKKAHDGGGFEITVNAALLGEERRYELAATYASGDTFTVEDAYRFWPTVGDLDLYLFGQGRHEHLWQMLGSHLLNHQGTSGVAFAVWAPNAEAVRVSGDFNYWQGRLHPMRRMGTSGVWELFVPAVSAGARYKFELLSAGGEILQRADPFAFACEVPPATASVVYNPTHVWQDSTWLEQRGQHDLLKEPFSTYEMHIGSWRRGNSDDDILSYRDLAEQLPTYLNDMGFTHVEFMPVAEHPFGGSWGYQVSSYYAPSSRFGTVDDFKYLVDALHAANIGVIVDWVPAHFPKDEWALARFDGSSLFEHADPRRGEHPDWGTLVFNLSRHEVRNFLLANALYWIEEFHIDGLRVDAVASMLYLDYSRQPGEWVPNEFGGRENLEAVSFLKEVNEIVYRTFPGVVTIAEESTAWPGVSRPTYLGGLGFGLKWNMGWMHDTLDYYSKEPIYRRFHHNDLTFGLIYAWQENFVLPLSHDEVVHGKGSLFNKMPGDKWQKHANLRALYAWMWAHPGKKLVFMGAELAQVREWSHDRSLDWNLLEFPEHLGTQELMKQLNSSYKDHAALWEQDFSVEGFRWIDASDVEQNVLSFLRTSQDGSQHLVCVANLSPVPRYGYRIGLPHGGPWREVLNTDAAEFGGSGVGNFGRADVLDETWHGLPAVASLTLPPLGVVWLAPGE